ncbi:hypothetical protein E1301_Tti019958 [Triplophysa tibetana]|uniref:Uncharacterized protein n=1 Tax=Triplophysa tibetana TaxID=1572043 RepID=A0A5A9NX52_9TELE|nr:hypothetical protein E1301_Tti019958 [Triplophysa tibetana]
MDVQQQDEGRDNTQHRVTTPENSSHVHTAQPKATGKPQEMTGPASSKMLCAERNLDHRESSESLTEAAITNDDALLLPDHIPTISHRIEKEKSNLPNGSPSSVTNGSAVVCTPPSGRTKIRTATSQTCNGHARSNGHRQRHAKLTPSTSNSRKSFKGDASQIQRVAGDGTSNTHTHTSGLLSPWGHSIGVMIFILYKLNIYSIPLNLKIIYYTFRFSKNIVLYNL